MIHGILVAYALAYAVTALLATFGIIFADLCAMRSRDGER